MRFGQQLAAFGVLAAMAAFFAMVTPRFLTVENLLTVALQIVIIAILAIGQTYVIVSGGIDLSVGSVLGFSGMVCGYLMRFNSWTPSSAIAAAILAGMLLGVVNGSLIHIGRLPPFIVTLGMMEIARGGALLLTDGLPITGFPDSFNALNGSRLAGAPTPVWIVAALAILFGVVLARGAFGRHVYAVGGNEQAARLSGVKVGAVKVAVYAICGALSGLAGVLMTARLVTAQATAGQGYELNAIAACVIGGASLMGGQGAIGGTIIGALITGILSNGLNLMNVSAFWQRPAVGAVIILAVFIDQVRRKIR